VRSMRVSLPLVALSVALVLGGGATRSAAKEPPATSASPGAILGISTRVSAGTLAWFDPLTLQPLRGRKIGLGFHTGSYAFSADRATLALGNPCGDDQGGVASLRFVNARAMRKLGDLRLSADYDCASTLAWLRPDRLLAVLSNTSTSRSEVVVVDPTTRRVLRHVSLPDAPSFATGATADELVLLLGSYDSFVPARVVAIDPDGALRETVVGNVLVGNVVDGSGQDFRARMITPGFAVDPSGRRVFLVPASGAIAEIDLRTLGVSYHALDHPSLLQRFFDWLTPAAEAKAIEGPVREARWLGGGVLAVSGVDYSIADEGKQTQHVLAKPAGVELVDTASWRSRMLSSAASGVAAGPGVVIAEGGAWDESSQVTTGPGLLAFALDGTTRWTLHPGEERSLYDATPSVGYVWLSQGKMEVVDLANGQVVRTLERNESANPWPWLLAAQRSG
jgi:hypothetical protein